MTENLEHIERENIRNGLLPCPFCGFHDQLIDKARETHGTKLKMAVYCVCCCMQGPVARSIKEAKQNWNMRKPMTGNDEYIGPIYGVTLLETLPIDKGGMLQQMPSRCDLMQVQKISQRTTAGFEVLTHHYQKRCDEVARLTDMIRQVIEGTWSVTELQEAIGDV